MGRKRGDESGHPQARLAHGGIARIVPSDFTSGFELLVDDTPQSHVDLEDPTHLHFEYIARMGALIDTFRLSGNAITAVHLGAGALTLPRYVSATRPGSLQQVIELESALVALVREHLPLPASAGIRIRTGDAREVARRLPIGLRGKADLVVSDVFSGAQTPAHLTTVEFYREVSTLLGQGGVLVVNVADGPGLAFARKQVATLATALPHVLILADTQILKGRRFGNIVITASASEMDVQWLPRLLAAGPHPSKVMSGEEVAMFMRGARIVQDADATASPRPDSSLFLR